MQNSKANTSKMEEMSDFVKDSEAKLASSQKAIIDNKKDSFSL